MTNATLEVQANRPTATSMGSVGGRRGRLVDNITATTSSRRASIESLVSVNTSVASTLSVETPRRYSVLSRAPIQRAETSQRSSERALDINFVRELGSQLRWRNRNLLASAQTFLPNLISEELQQNAIAKSEPRLPSVQNRSGCIAKVHCSGFVELTERLECHTNGAAMLSKCINRFYSHIIDIVMSYRGDVVRFNANTMIVFFEATDDCNSHKNACGALSCYHSAQELSCIRAAACCIELHKHLHHTDAGEGEGELSLQIGIGAGTMKVLVVSAGSTAESVTSIKYTVTGPPLEQATQAEKLAGPAETVFSPQAWQHVQRTSLEGEPVTQQPSFHRFLAFDIRMHTYPMVRHAALQSVPETAFSLGSHPRSGSVRRCLALLMNFLPDSVLRHIWAGTLSNVNELRTLSIAFVNIKGIDPFLSEGVQMMASIITELQKAAFAEEGYLHRFLLDDNGLFLQFAFGMPPLVHTDDPLRACRACARMLCVVQLFDLGASAGVATGKVFCGLVGCDRRHEYGIMGSAVQRAMSLSEAAETSVVMVDEVTGGASEMELDFDQVEVAVDGLEEPGIPAFRLHPGSADRERKLFSSHFTPLSAPSKAQPLLPGQPQDEPPLPTVDPTPCTPPVKHRPPWLAGSICDDNRIPVEWEQPIPTLWTHICAERPSPLPFRANKGPGAAKQPWRTFIKVPLPWPARSTACGGVSPLPRLRCWRHLLEAECAADACIEDGGGLMVLVGPFGCGKTELTEHIVTRSVMGSENMQPIFGAMEARIGQRWAAISGVLCGALALLQPSGRVQSAHELSDLLRKEVSSDLEERALLVAGLLEHEGGTRSRGGGTPYYSRSICSVQGVTSSRSLTSPQGSRKNTPREHKVRSPTASKTPAPDAMRATRTSTESDTDEENQSPRDLHYCRALVAMAIRLIQRLLVNGSVVVALRISQGTSVLPTELLNFWLLARAIGDLALEHCKQRNSQHSLLAVVTCREEHLDPGLDSRHAAVTIGPLTTEEINRYVHLCLGVVEETDVETPSHPRRSSLRSGLRGTASGGEHSPPPPPPQFAMAEMGRATERKVPDVLLHWLRRVADLPRHLEEGLTQLRRAGVITVVGGRYEVQTNAKLLESVDWIHTHMVGRIISQMEVMVPEMQHVLQIATVLPGAFSSLDLAAAIRVDLAWDTPNMMALYLCVKHLIACGELVQAGFLRRVDGDPNEDPDERSCMPRWVVTSFRIKQVVGSTVLQGMRMQLKRAILLSRAQEQLRFSRNRSAFRQGRRASDASFCSEATRSAKSLGRSVRQRARFTGRGAAPWDVNVSNARSLGLPSSCIITSFAMQGGQRSSEVSQGTGGDTDDDISFEMPAAAEMPSPTTGEQVLVLPVMLRRSSKLIHKCLIFTIVVVVLLYPDLWIILEGSPASRDAVMLVAMIFFAADIFCCVRYDHDYTHRTLFTDLVLFVLIFLDISWALAKPHTELVLQRRNPDSFWRIIGLYVKFGACAVRLTLFIRSMAGLLQNGFEKRVKTRWSARSSNSEKEDTSLLLEDISKRLTQAILLHLVTFTILIILSVQIVDLFTPPQEDASMQSWVHLLTHEVNISNSIAAPMLQEELQRFKQFYSDMTYGPYHICLGTSQPEAAFNCSHELWQSPDGSDFANPHRQSFQLDIHSGTVMASFDFSRPAKHEALIRMMIISTTVLCMVIVALSLDSVTRGLVVSPLARLLPTVRQVMAQLREKFPTLEVQDNTEEHDVVARFEDMVEKITLIVTAANRGTVDSQAAAATSEWISGISVQKKPSAKISKHLPYGAGDNTLTNDVRQLEELGVCYELVDSWHLDVLTLDHEQASGVAAWLLLDCANPYLSLQPQVVATFLDCMEMEYRDENPYHNWRHACDVLHGVFRGCLLNRFLEFSPRVDVFALFVAAIAHDAGHPGLNNIFLVQTSHELALRYNDLSPLENMHCSTMFRILSSEPEANIFSVLSKEQYREARQVCIDTILHTDNSKHFEMIKELQMFYHTNSDVFERQGTSDRFPTAAEVELLHQVRHRRLMMTALLHGMDISNPCKPWTICESWADLVLSEFFAQGDQEKQLGIPVQMLNNRDTVNKPSSQVAFIEFFIYPFNTALVKIFSPLADMSMNLHENLQIWQGMRTAEEQEKTGPKIQAICDDLLVVMKGAQQRLGSKKLSISAVRSEPSERSVHSSPRLTKANTCVVDYGTGAEGKIRGPVKSFTATGSRLKQLDTARIWSGELTHRSFLSASSAPPSRPASPAQSANSVPLPNVVPDGVSDSHEPT